MRAIVEEEVLKSGILEGRTAKTKQKRRQVNNKEKEEEINEVEEEREEAAVREQKGLTIL